MVSNDSAATFTINDRSKVKLQKRRFSPSNGFMLVLYDSVTTLVNKMFTAFCLKIVAASNLE